MAVALSLDIIAMVQLRRIDDGEVVGCWWRDEDKVNGVKGRGNVLIARWRHEVLPSALYVGFGPQNAILQDPAI